MAAKQTVPSDITTQEQLVVWSLMSLDVSAPTQAVLERPNLTSFQVEWQLVKAPDGTTYFVGRTVIEMADIDSLPDGSKPWLQAQPIPQSATIPAYYGTN